MNEEDDFLMGGIEPDNINWGWKLLLWVVVLSPVILLFLGIRQLLILVGVI